MTDLNRWADLRVRLLSAAVMIGLGTFEVYEGGMIFLIGILLLIGAMVWEIAELTAVQRGPLSIGLGVAAALCLYLWTTLATPVAGLAMLALPSMALLLTPRRDRVLLAAYALVVMVAGSGFLTLRDQGAGVFLWLVLVVVVSDTMGYFAGRLLGGPKFWPKISPKKTWSGTVAGWVGAAVIGLIFALNGFPVALMILSPLVAFAGQMGDIAESWIKRRAGVKDSSGLIPGHGGVLDRFDALVGAMVALLALNLIVPGVG